MKKYFSVIILLFVCSLINAISDESFKNLSQFKDLTYSDIYKLGTFLECAYCRTETIYNTFFLAQECIKNNIEGDFVECGVAHGGQIGAMGYACQKLKTKRKIHLFDSFEGIPLAGPNDDSQPGIGAITHSINVENLDDLLVSSGISVGSVESVENRMKQWGISDMLEYHVGWFQYVLPVDAYKISSISLLRLDGDLYESTRVCLEYLYPKVQKGGFVIIDDWGLRGCYQAVNEYLRAHHLNPHIISLYDGGPVYWRVD